MLLYVPVCFVSCHTTLADLLVFRFHRQPLALLDQWREEIEEKTVANYWSVLVYHGKSKEGIKLKHLKKYDVVSRNYAERCCAEATEHN